MHSVKEATRSEVNLVAVTRKTKVLVDVEKDAAKAKAVKVRQVRVKEKGKVSEIRPANLQMLRKQNVFVICMCEMANAPVTTVFTRTCPRTK